MNNNIKTSVGFLVPLSSLAIFLYFSLLGNFLSAMLAVIGGVMFWYLYSLVMESKMPDITGNVVIFFGSLLSVAFFLNYGISKNMFGGFGLSLEGATASAVLLFFSVLLGISLRSKPPVFGERSPVSERGAALSFPDEPLVPDQGRSNEKNKTEDINDDYSYYDPAEYEYPDYDDYEYDENGGVYDEDD